MLFLTFVLTYNFLKELNMPSKLAMSLLGLLFTASTVLAQTPGGAPAPAALVDKVAKSIKKGGSKALPLETNFGNPITYKALGKNCAVEGNLVKAKRPGSCIIKATAAAKVDTWVALETTVVIPIK